MTGERRLNLESKHTKEIEQIQLMAECSCNKTQMQTPKENIPFTDLKMYQ